MTPSWHFLSSHFPHSIRFPQLDRIFPPDFSFLDNFSRQSQPPTPLTEDGTELNFFLHFLFSFFFLHCSLPRPTDAEPAWPCRAETSASAGSCEEGDQCDPLVLILLVPVCLRAVSFRPGQCKEVVSPSSNFNYFLRTISVDVISDQPL